MTGTSRNYCPSCGHALAERYVPEEERDRLVCVNCSRIHYVNPIVVAGVIPVAGGDIWLLRRGIQPRYGTWTFPAGYMEMGESSEQAAIRETREELGSDVELTGLLGVYSRPHMASVLVVYTATVMTAPTGGTETLSYARFKPHQIPWKGLSFWNTEEALRDWLRTRDE